MAEGNTINNNFYATMQIVSYRIQLLPTDTLNIEMQTELQFYLQMQIELQR